MLRSLLVFFAGLLVSISAQASTGEIQAIEEDFLVDGQLQSGGDLGLIAQEIQDWPGPVQSALLRYFEARAQEPGLSTDRPGVFTGDLSHWQVKYSEDDNFGGKYEAGFTVGDLYVVIYNEAGGFWPGEYDDMVLYILDSGGQPISRESFYIE